MREYELVYITGPDLAVEKLSKIHDKVIKIVQDNGGELLVEKDWGKRKLAYRMGKFNFGHYFYYGFKGTGSFIQDLERTLKYEEDVLRFMTVRLDDADKDRNGNLKRVHLAEEGKLRTEEFKPAFFGRQDADQERAPRQTPAAEGVTNA